MAKRAGRTRVRVTEHVDPIDEDEQEATLRKYEEQQAESKRNFRLIFGVLTLMFGITLFTAAGLEARSPWQQKFTGELRTVADAGSVLVALCLQATSMLLLAYTLLVKYPGQDLQIKGTAQTTPSESQRPLALAVMATLAAAAGGSYWMYLLYKSVAVHGPELGSRWSHLWLPLGPVGIALLCVYMLVSLSATDKELAQWRSLKYPFKKV